MASPSTTHTPTITTTTITTFTTTFTGSDDNRTDSGITPPEGCLAFPFSGFTPWNQPEDLVSHDTRQAVNKFVNVYMLTLLVCVSVPSNLVNLLVFWRHGLRERINLCLFCSAFADLMTVLPHFLWNLDALYSEITGAPYRLVVMKAFINSMLHSLAGFIYVSGFMCTLIALERCLCVVSPLKAQSVVKTSTAAAVIAVGHVVILAGHHVIATRWRVVCMFDPLVGRSVDAFYSSAFYLRNKLLVDFMDGVVFGVVLPGSYVAGVLVSTIVTVLKLKEMALWRDQSASYSTTATSSTSAGTGTGSAAVRDVTLTRMLIGTSCLFVACTTPPLLFHAAIPFVPELSLSGKLYNTYYTFINLQQLLTYLNASVNFFIYYAFGTKFRGTVRSLFGSRVRGAKSGNPGRKGARLSVPERVGTGLPSVSRTPATMMPEMKKEEVTG